MPRALEGAVAIVAWLGLPRRGGGGDIEGGQPGVEKGRRGEGSLRAELTGAAETDRKPDRIAALLDLAHARRTQGRLDDAVACYRQALAILPDDPDIHLGLGSVFQAQGRLDAAIACYERALAGQPDFVASLVNLGTCHSLLGRYETAGNYYRAVLVLDQTLPEANQGMATVLEAEGRLEEAEIFHDRIPRPLPLSITKAPEQRRTILITSVAGLGNVPLHSLLKRRSWTRIHWAVDLATDEQEAMLPPYDVAFNAIGNADLMGRSCDRLARYHANRPLLNPPDAVARTRRDRLPELLAGIPNVVVPRIVRFRRDELVKADLPALLAQAGLACPVLMRPVALHGGGGMVLLETQEQLADIPIADADAFYFIAYHDYRSGDDHYRKYRTIFVDRQPYPYHLAICDRWLAHYFSADMPAAPWKLEEERRFLADPATILGPVATAALAAIGRRMNMDFAGIDFSISPDGSVLVFEANATMSVYVPDSAETLPDDHAPARAIVSAFEAMLESHAQKYRA